MFTDKYKLGISKHELNILTTISVCSLDLYLNKKIIKYTFLEKILFFESLTLIIDGLFEQE